MQTGFAGSLFAIMFLLPTSVFAAPPTYVAESSGTSPTVSFTIQASSTAAVAVFFPNGDILAGNDNAAACGTGGGFTPATGDGSFDLSIPIDIVICSPNGTNSTKTTYTVLVASSDGGNCAGSATLVDLEACYDDNHVQYAEHSYTWTAASSGGSFPWINAGGYHLHTATGTIFQASSTVAAVGLAAIDIGGGMTTIVGYVLAALVGLLGLGFGVRKLKKYITGDTSWVGSGGGAGGDDETALGSYSSYSSYTRGRQTGGRNRNGGLNMLDSSGYDT